MIRRMTMAVLVALAVASAMGAAMAAPCDGATASEYCVSCRTCVCAKEGKACSAKRAQAASVAAGKVEAERTAEAVDTPWPWSAAPVSAGGMPVVVRVVLGGLAAGVILVIVFVRRARVRRDVVAAVNAKSRSLLLDKPYIQPRIQTEINDANASVDVCVFAFDNYAVAAALASAAARGVKVRVMINAGGAHLGVIQRLRRANIAHKQVSVPMGLLHAKFIVFDGGAKAIMGSANFTANGFTMNEEVMCYDEGSIAIDLQARFEMLWAKY